jgi:hypothetical protein
MGNASSAAGRERKSSIKSQQEEMKEPVSGIEATVRIADSYMTRNSFWSTSVNA